MPSASTAKWPKPRSEDEFEDICVDFVRIRWRDPHASRNGRRGQGQSGVDIIGNPEWLKGRIAGAQCKNSAKLNLDQVVAEIDKAENFEGGLAEFLVLTSGDRDAALLTALRKHLRSKPSPFRVEVIFWDDLVADLSSDERLVAKHWKDFAPARAVNDADVLRDLAAIFDRPAFTTPFHAESSLRAFKQALNDTILSLNTGVRETRSGAKLPALASRHQIKDPRVRTVLGEVHEALTRLRAKYDTLTRSGDLRHCDCDDPECPVFMLTDKAIREMDEGRQSVLELFRGAYPEFTVHVGRW